MSEGASTDSLLLNGCDTHVHIIGPQDTYAMVQSRHYTPGPASVQQLKSHLANQGIGKAVIVQPSVYGTDNSCLLAAIADMGQQAKGIAVLDPQISASALQALDRQGIRGIRLNFESSGNQSVDQLKQALTGWAPTLEGLGWHFPVYAPFTVTTACASLIQALSVPVVLDHFGLWPANHIETPETRPMLRLFEAGHIYIKLSASYRLPNFETQKLNQLAHHLLQVRPDRLLWASDWPHTNREPGLDAHSVSPYRNIEAAQLVDERHGWLLTPELKLGVLMDNPARLYRF